MYKDYDEYDDEAMDMEDREYEERNRARARDYYNDSYDPDREYHEIGMSRWDFF